MEEKVWEGGEGVMKKDTISSQAASSGRAEGRSSQSKGRADGLGRSLTKGSA